MLTNCSNIFKGATPPKLGETFETLLSVSNIIIKRIVSSSHIDSELMCQDEDEWFIMIEGAATIMIGNKRQELVSGDYCFIEAKKPHQILSVKEGTIWLAVHVCEQRALLL